MATMAQHSKRRFALRVGLAAAAVLATTPKPAEASEPRTKVILNGELVPVTFNDGDSFRVLAGSYKDAKARLAGYNTLESFGAVHQWGTWTAKELYIVAKMATMHARKGIWECTTDGNVDTYGRMLVECPTLREDLIRRGMAHVMTIDDNPGLPELVAAQNEAKAAKRGIWAHGIPAFILTSLHSAEEDVSGKGTYNRLVSTEDGHSVKWKHETKYPECTNVCQKVYTVDDAKVKEVAEELRAGTELYVFGTLKHNDLLSVVHDFAKFRHINRKVPEDNREEAKKVLMSFAAQGKFGEQQESNGACMVHVDFKRRFGTGRASCLK